MKRASVFVLLLGLIACKHPSRLEAEKACLEWDAQEVSFNYERELLGFEKRQKFEQEHPRPDAAYWDDEIIEWDEQKKAYAETRVTEVETIGSRYCEDDQQSMQFLGYENDAVHQGTYQDLSGQKGEWRVVRRFRY